MKASTQHYAFPDPEIALLRLARCMAPIAKWVDEGGEPVISRDEWERVVLLARSFADQVEAAMAWPDAVKRLGLTEQR